MKIGGSVFEKSSNTRQIFVVLFIGYTKMMLQGVQDQNFRIQTAITQLLLT